MKRRIYASKETSFNAELSDDKIVRVYSLFPIDRADCICHKTIRDFKKRLAQSMPEDRDRLVAQTRVVICPKDKSLMNRYEISCKNCKEVVGVCWASDATLRDWCDFHYVQWSDGELWYGCLTPHISPITEELCIECCCGQDTRDFRANMNLSVSASERLEGKNSKGREFGKSDSKFLVRKLKTNMLR